MDNTGYLLITSAIFIFIFSRMKTRKEKESTYCFPINWNDINCHVKYIITAMEGSQLAPLLITIVHERYCNRSVMQAYIIDVRNNSQSISYKCRGIFRIFPKAQDGAFLRKNSVIYSIIHASQGPYASVMLSNILQQLMFFRCLLQKAVNFS